MAPTNHLSSFALFILLATAANHCQCGWRLKDPPGYFTHRIHNDFGKYPNAKDLNWNPGTVSFAKSWMVMNYNYPADSLEVRRDKRYESKNVEIRDGHLVFTQRAYSAADFKANKAVSVAALQKRAVDVLHGTFRATMKVEGNSGGSVASLFWYSDDNQEIDIEIVTRGTSLVNNTISYTSHPSVFSDGQPIPGASCKVAIPEDDVDYLTKFRTFRFDCDPNNGVKYYLDGELQHSDKHHIPSKPGSVQLSLWADGNHWWSGIPSTTDVHMAVKEIDMYFNTSMTDSGLDKHWHDECIAAGGPSDETVCLEGTEVGADASTVPPGPVVSSMATTPTVPTTVTQNDPEPQTSDGTGNRRVKGKDSLAIYIYITMVAVVLAQTSLQSFRYLGP